jgi:hypothetical protein
VVQPRRAASHPDDTGPPRGAPRLPIMIRMVLLVMAIPVVLIGCVRLAVRVLGWVRRNRGEATWALSTGILPDWLTEAIDGWVSDATPQGFDGPGEGGSHSEAADQCEGSHGGSLDGG